MASDSAACDSAACDSAASDASSREHLSRVAVVIPALNEADNLRRLLPMLAPLRLGQIIVGDNGSTDDTASIAASLGATVEDAPDRGYGAACQAAIAGLADDIDVVVFFDADIADDPSLIPSLAAPILTGTHDLVIGNRIAALREGGSMSLPQRFGDALATHLIRFGWGYRYHDLGPFRAVRRSSLERIDMQDRRFGWTIEMQIRAIEENLRILQLPVPYRRRRGKSKISGTVKGVFLAGYWILKTWLTLYLTRSARATATASISKPEN